MKKIKAGNRFSRFLKLIYLKLFRINDTPQRIALGLGLGVFLGILPGSGPVASLFLAWVFRLNRAAALLGSLATNTWLSIVTFLLAVKAGAYVLQLNQQEVCNSWISFLKNFHFFDLFKLSILRVILPVALGYLIVSFLIGFVVYLIVLVILTGIKNAKNQGRINLSR